MPIIKANDLKTRSVEGGEHGATISLILDRSEPGRGPRLHRHRYDETWVIQEGHLAFQAGDERHDAGPGDIVFHPGRRAAQVHEHWPWQFERRLHPRQPSHRRRMAGMSRTSLDASHQTRPRSEAGAAFVRTIARFHETDRGDRERVVVDQGEESPPPTLTGGLRRCSLVPGAMRAPGIGSSRAPG